MILCERSLSARFVARSNRFGVCVCVCVCERSTTIPIFWEENCFSLDSLAVPNTHMHEHHECTKTLNLVPAGAANVRTHEALFEPCRKSTMKHSEDTSKQKLLLTFRGMSDLD